MVTSYHHFLGQLGIVTSPSGQRVRISKVMLVKKHGVGDQGRKRRKGNVRTHSKGTKECTGIGSRTGTQDKEGRGGQEVS